MDLPEEEPKEKKVPEELTCPEWMMTMGDCMSLLLTFFVLLLTFSTNSKARLMDVVGIMKGAFSMVDAENPLNKEESAVNEAGISQEDSKIEEGKEDNARVKIDELSPVNLFSMEVQRQFKVTEKRLKEIGMKTAVTLQSLKYGLSLEMEAGEVFLGDSTEHINEAAVPALREVANLAANVDNEIRVVTLISSSEQNKKRTSSAWKLAIQRSTKVAEFLQRKYMIKRERFSYGTTVVTDPKQVGKIRFIIMQKVGVKEKSFEDVLKGQFVQ